MLFILRQGIGVISIKLSFCGEIKLEYRDERGHLLMGKEAYRDMCYQFHGHGSSKKNQERRLKQIERERMEYSKSSASAASGGVGGGGAHSNNTNNGSDSSAAAAAAILLAGCGGGGNAEHFEHRW